MSLDKGDIPRRVGAMEYELKALLLDVGELVERHNRQVAKLVARIAQLEAELAVAARVPR